MGSGLRSLAIGVGGGVAGADVGIGIIFRQVAESVTRRPEMRDEITASSGSGSRSRDVLLLRPHRRADRVRALNRRGSAEPVFALGGPMLRLALTRCWRTLGA